MHLIGTDHSSERSDYPLYAQVMHAVPVYVLILHVLSTSCGDDVRRL
jgi:hypothetical protein